MKATTINSRITNFPIKNKLFFNDNDDQNHYFKGNLQVTDFNKVLESSPTKTSHMSIEAVNDN